MEYGTAKSYRVFTRTWWHNNPDWPKGLEPKAGRKHTIGIHFTEEEAQAFAKEWNATRELGRLLLKAEYEEE